MISSHNSDVILSVPTNFGYKFASVNINDLFNDKTKNKHYNEVLPSKCCKLIFDFEDNKEKRLDSSLVQTFVSLVENQLQTLADELGLNRRLIQCSASKPEILEPYEMTFLELRKYAGTIGITNLKNKRKNELLEEVKLKKQNKTLDKVEQLEPKSKELLNNLGVKKKNTFKKETIKRLNKLLKKYGYFVNSKGEISHILDGINVKLNTNNSSLFGFCVNPT